MVARYIGGLARLCYAVYRLAKWFDGRGAVGGGQPLSIGMEQPFPCPVFYHASLPSTQDEARKLVSQGSFPFVVMADEQVAGRGRSGRKWVSLPDNLQCTLVFESQVDMRHIGQYAFLVAVAMQATIESFGVTDISLKWPNDILRASKKIAGILIEIAQGVSDKSVLLVGMGVNIINAPAEAAVLDTQGNAGVTPRQFLDKFLTVFFPLKEQMEQGGFADIRTKWLAHAHGLGGMMQVRLPTTCFEGVFVGLAEDGALHVQVAGENAPRVVYSGDVFIGGTS